MTMQHPDELWDRAQAIKKAGTPLEYRRAMRAYRTAQRAYSKLSHEVRTHKFYAKNMAKRRTAAQIRATKKLVALNKKRAKARTNRGRPKTKRRAAAKRTNRAKRATQCNPRRSSAKGLTVAQGKRLYQLGRRAPKTPVAIKRTKKGYSILTGKAVMKQRQPR